MLGFLLAMFSSMGVFLLWGGFLGGGLVGEVFLRVTSRKRGPKMEIAVGVCTAIGIILSFLVRWQSLVFAVEGADIMIALQMHPFYVISAGLAVFAAVGKVRFFS